MSKEQSVKKRAGIHYGWICATGGLSSQFVYEIPLGIFPLVMASMMIALGMTSAEAGLIISMSGVTLIVGSPAWGVIVSKNRIAKSTNNWFYSSLYWYNRYGNRNFNHYGNGILLYNWIWRCSSNGYK